MLDNQNTICEHIITVVDNSHIKLFNALPKGYLATIIMNSFLLGIEYEKARHNDLSNNKELNNNT